MRKFFAVIAPALLALTFIVAAAPAPAAAQDCTARYVVWDDTWSTGVALVNPTDAMGFTTVQLYSGAGIEASFSQPLLPMGVYTFALPDIAPAHGRYVLRVCGAQAQIVMGDGNGWLGW